MNFLMVNCSWVSNFSFGKEEKESVIFVLHFLFCIIHISMSLLFFSFSFFFFLALLGLHCCMQAFSSCSQRGLLLQLWCAGLVATQNVGSSWTKDQTHIPCIGKWILNHWTTRDVQFAYFYLLDSSNSYAKFPTLALASMMVKPDFVRVLLYIFCCCSFWSTGIHSLYL